MGMGTWTCEGSVGYMDMDFRPALLLGVYHHHITILIRLRLRLEAHLSKSKSRHCERAPQQAGDSIENVIFTILIGPYLSR